MKNVAGDATVVQEMCLTKSGESVRRPNQFMRFVLVSALTVVAAACSVDAPSSVAPAGAPVAGPTSGPSAPSEGSSSSGGLEWTAVDFGCDFIGDIEARGRVTNGTVAAISSAAFTITVVQGGRIAATLSGLVADLEPGATKTVEFISTDDCLEGDFTYEIQTDFAFGGGSSIGGNSDRGADSSDALVWSMVDFGCDFIGDVEARGRVENTGQRSIASGAFTITVFQQNRIVATLTGFVSDLAPGATKTVEFISTDDCLEGEFTYDIQTDFAFQG